MTEPQEIDMRDRIMVSFLVLAGAALLCAGAQGQANLGKGKRNAGPPDSGMVLHLEVRRVPVDVVVLDKNGNPVGGLRKEDFTIKEDGKTQNVLSFDWMDGSKPSPVPIKLPSLPPNTFMNAATVPERGPLYVLYFDMVNMGPENQMTFHNELMKFIDEAQPGTRMALFVNATGLHLLQGFTTDHALLREAVLRKGPGPHVPKVFLYGENFGSSDVGGALSNLRFLAEYLDGIPGRKNLLWMADNFPIPVTPTLAVGTSKMAIASAPAQAYSVGAQGGPQVLDLTELERDNMKHTFAALMRSQIALYPIDVSGVTGAIADYERWDMIAEATGGHAYYSDNRPHLELEKAVEHGESYYTLSYAPTNMKYDGTERHIEVKLANNDGDYKLTYRHGYYALSDDDVEKLHKKEPLQTRFMAAKATDTLYANIEHGAPILHDLLFSAHLAADGAHMATAEEMQALEDSPEYFKMRTKHPQKGLPPVKLQKYMIDYGVVDPQLRAAVAHHQKPSPLEFAAAAYDEDGRLLNSMLNQGLPSGAGGSQAALFHAIQELEAPAGAAFIRLAVRDTMTNRTGTLEVRLPLKADTDTASAGGAAKGPDKVQATP